MDTFEDEDIFRQFDVTPDNSVRQNISKDEVLDILDLVRYTLERAWFISCGGNKRKLKRLATLDEIRSKILACPDDVNMAMVLENTAAPSSCVPPLFGRNTEKMLEKQLSTTLQFLEMQQSIGDTDDATIGQSIAEDEEELEMMSCRSQTSGSDTTVVSNTSYDADSERSTNESLPDGLSVADESESFTDVVVTTCNVETDLGDPLGVSITTWSRRKLNTESMRSTKTNLASIVPAEAKAAKTDDSDEENGDDDADDGNEESLEEVSVSFGDGIVLHASRTRSVRFTGIKPSTDDNINRALELLNSARELRQRFSSDVSC